MRDYFPAENLRKKKHDKALIILAQVKFLLGLRLLGVDGVDVRYYCKIHARC